nr:MAG TPA: hypothetical protein [Caudoviricetes sp.]
MKRKIKSLFLTAAALYAAGCIALSTAATVTGSPWLSTHHRGLVTAQLQVDSAFGVWLEFYSPFDNADDSSAGIALYNPSSELSAVWCNWF